MSRELFIKRWEMEQPTFLKVFRALPSDQLDYRPHPRSSSAAGLVWRLAEEQRVLCDLLDKGEFDWKLGEPPNTLDALIKAYESHAEGVRSRLHKADDTKWNSVGKFKMGEKVLSSPQTRVNDLFWGFLFDAVHHRGQLTAYIRPMGGKVPSIYGPSADETLGL